MSSLNLAAFVRAFHQLVAPAEVSSCGGGGGAGGRSAALVPPAQSASSRTSALALLLALAVLAPRSWAQSWTQVTPTNPPSVRNHAAMAYHAGLDATVLFGGYNATATPLADTWAYSGTAWSQLLGAQPPGRWGHRMVYDTRRERLVMFGGFQPNGGFVPDAIGRNDTWEFDGFSWAQRPTTTQPSPRGYFGMAYNSIRGRTVVFGGMGPNTTYLNDTWEWDGATWTPIATASRPSIRRGPAMAFDTERGEMVLFGGGAFGTTFGDTWVYNGSNWTQRTPATSPPARWEASMTFDPLCGNAVMQGGAVFSYATAFGDSWTWNGATWTAGTGTQPTARYGAAMGFDPQRSAAVVFGGRDNVGFKNDSWESVSGCTRTMSVVADPAIGSTAQFRYDYPTTAIGNLHLNMLTLHNANAFRFPVPGFLSVGYAQVDIFFVLQQTFGILGATGNVVSSVAIPNDGAFHGFSFDVQSLDLDGSTDMICWAENDLEVTVRPLIADFTATPTSGVAPLQVQFTDNSTSAPTSWQWDFDNNGTVDSTVQNPTMTYSSPGTYSVRLVARNIYGSGTLTRVGYIQVSSPPPPVASFTATPTSGVASLQVQFTDTSTNAPTSWQWDFDNNGTVDSTVQNPTRTFTPGTYSVRLVASNAGGSGTLTRVGYIQVSSPPPPVASFTATPTSGVASLQVQFTDTSTNAPTSWQWDFDNNGTVDSTVQNPTRTYSTPGTYSVRLVARNAGGSGTVTRLGLITVYLHPASVPILVPIPAGTFQMGSAVIGGVSAPVHTVTITRPFWVGKYEVTQAEYQAVRGTNPSFFQGASYPNAPQRPVETVSRTGAMAYCAELTAAEAAAGRIPAGYQYRLPTEAEWEYVCRAGTTTEWNTGASITTLQANFNDTSSSSQTTVVGSYPANPWGLFDTHGNVSELCFDTWVGALADYPYPSSAVSDPYAFVGGDKQVARGGDWRTFGLNSTARLASAYRGEFGIAPLGDWAGFRVVLAPVLFFGPNSSLNMVPIPAGTDQMGSAVIGGVSAPVHTVTITRPFWVGKYEVTQAEYQAVRGTNPSHFKGAGYPDAPQRPVEQVSWYDAMAYCFALTATEAAAGRIPPGYQYRLPTEAESEYVCRARTNTEWNTGYSLPASLANFFYSRNQTSVVGSYADNAWGLFDTHGNVAEWCLDSWDGLANYPSSAVSDPYVFSGPGRHLRGGGWDFSADGCRSAFRGGAVVPGDKRDDFGFRVVLAPVLVGPNPSLDMIPIPAGTFQMGATVVGGTAVPVHAVSITQPFWCGRYEVTQAGYQAVRGTNPSHFQGVSYPNAQQRPVERVTWNDAMAYCAALTATESAAGRLPAGYQYRLPTEAEWEYVCRAGTTTDWNTGAGLSTSQANFGAPFYQTTVVGIYAANPWGLFDTHGNVWEWCLDSWDGLANYPSSAVSDPYVFSGPSRVLRGGGWSNGTAGNCRSAFRDYVGPGFSDYSIGFRVVLAPVLVP